MRVFGRLISPICPLSPESDRISRVVEARRAARQTSAQAGRPGTSIATAGSAVGAPLSPCSENPLQRHLLFDAGTNPHFDKPFFDIGANHIGMIFLQIVKA